jgi:hypothetical protein
MDTGKQGLTPLDTPEQVAPNFIFDRKGVGMRIKIRDAFPLANGVRLGMACRMR